MSANLIPISSDGGFVTAGNITVSLTTGPVSSPAPYITGFASVETILGANLGGFEFNSNGVAIMPTGETVFRNNGDTITLASYDTPNSISRNMRLGDNGGLYLEQTGSIPSENRTWLTINPNAGNVEITGSIGIVGSTEGGDLSITGGAADPSTYNTSSGGNVNITGGPGGSDDGGGGGPGGSVNITAGNSLDPAGHAGNVVIQAGSANTWTFDYTGNLTSTGSIQVQNIRTVDGTVHVGQGAGLTGQGTYAIAMGRFAGGDTQGAAGVAIGQLAGQTNQGQQAIALGLYAANNTQGANSVAIGTYAANLTQGENSVAIGSQAGSNAQGQQAVAIGYHAGNITQGPGAVAIGLAAGSNTQGNNSVAFGTQAAEIQQGIDAISIGTLAGRVLQANSAIAIGSSAAIGGQGEHSIAIGSGAGGNTQATLSIAMGLFAGEDHQGTKAVAIGAYAGNIGQGANSIAIGASAGVTNQASSSIILNATGATLNGTNSGFYVAPVRNDTSNVTNVVYFNTSTKELTYGPAGSGSYGDSNVVTLLNSFGSNTITTTGNITANNFVGNISITGNVTGTSSNVTLVAGSYSYTFDNAGTLTLPAAASGNEGGEIAFTQAANSTLAGNTVVMDNYVDRFRFFEAGGNARGAYIDLSIAADGVGTLLNNRASGIVNAGVDVTLGNLKARIPTSGNRSLQVSTVSGSYSVFGSAQYTAGGTVGGTNIVSGFAVSVTTTPAYLASGNNFGTAGDAGQWIIMDNGAGLAWRISFIIGASFNNNLITIERLI